MTSQVDKAVSVLNKGVIIIFPTDTAFGIGCRIDKAESVERLFEIRKRPKNQATPVLVSSIVMARNYFLEIPKEVEHKLVEKYWPGALTIVLPAKTKKVPELVRGMQKSVGIRVPNNPTILEIIKKTGVPILGPSANMHGENTPFKLEDLDKELVSKVDFVVKGEVALKNISTVIDCSVKPWKILRQGAIKISDTVKNILFIDTSDNQKIELGLVIEAKKYKEIVSLTALKREIVLNLIDKIIAKHNLNLKEITEIKVNNGPGSFTGLRAGISIANALASILNIPINGKKIGDLENAVYN